MQNLKKSVDAVFVGIKLPLNVSKMDFTVTTLFNTGANPRKQFGRNFITDEL